MHALVQPQIEPLTELPELAELAPLAPLAIAFAYLMPVSKSENVNGNMFVTVFAGAGYPLFKRKLEIAPNMNATYNKYTNFINNQENVTQNTSISGGVDFEINLDSIEINFGNNFSYTSPVSSLSSVSNTPYTSQTYSVDINWQLPFHFKFKAEADYTINSRRAQGFNRNIFIINTEISKAFTKTENFIVGISGNDLLNQNLNVQRQVNGNVITDNYTKIISRYFNKINSFKEIIQK
jgi:hypothetical protein